MRPILMKTIVAAVVPAGLLVGCASVPNDAGFADVKSDVARRSGQRIVWNARTLDDQTAADAMRQMLAQGLDADRAVQIALLNNRRLQATYEDLGVAQADVVQAGLLRNPVFDGEVKFLSGGDQIIDLSVTQDFLGIFYIPLRKKVAANNFEAAKLRVTGAVIDLAGQARSAFYVYEATEQTLDLRRTIVDASAASYDFARRLHDAGNIKDLDLANERALYEQSKLDLAQAEQAVLASRERLNVLLGLWGSDTRWSASGRLPDPPASEVATNEIERRAVEQNLDLAVGRKQIESAARTLGIQRSLGLLPEAEAGVAAERDPGEPWAVGPAFSLPIPLLDQGQGRSSKAAAELERARQQFYATAVEVRSAARQARNDLLAARSRADYYRQVVLPLRRQITHETQLQYNAMLVGTFQLLQAKQAEVEAGVQYINALRDYWLARTQLDQITSGRLSDVAQTATMSTSASLSSDGRGSGGH